MYVRATLVTQELGLKDELAQDPVSKVAVILRPDEQLRKMRAAAPVEETQQEEDI